MNKSCKLNIINRVESLKDNITEEDLDTSIVPALLEYYDPKIRTLAKKTYNNSSEVAYKAFKELSRDKLKKAVLTFSVKKCHWKNNRSLNSYLMLSLNRMLADNKSVNETKNIPICPICLDYCFVIIKPKKLDEIHCKSCTEKDNNGEGTRINSIFKLHTRKGFGCPDCDKFIPYSFVKGKDRVSCVYDNCSWFGLFDELKFKAHPTRRGINVIDVYIDNQKSNIYNQENNLKTRNINTDFKLCDQAYSYERLQVIEDFKNDFLLIEETIKTHIDRVADTPSNKGFMKKLMYKAFLNILKEEPEDIIAYLVQLRSRTDYPLQAKIYQEYVRLVENFLPISIRSLGKDFEIYSVVDKNLKLFLGISEFLGEVTSKNIIYNNTKEHYISSSTNDLGICFIGLLEDVIDADGNSLKGKIESYCFSNIKMNKEVSPGTKVKVIHYRIPPHYEIGSLSLLQSVKRKIVDSIYMKKTGKRRNEKS